MSWLDKVGKALKPVARDAGKAAATSAEESLLKSAYELLDKLRDQKLSKAVLGWIRRIHDVTGEILASQSA